MCWHTCLSEVHQLLKNLISKIQDGGLLKCQSDPFCILMRYQDFLGFQNDSCLLSWIFEIEIFNSYALKKHILRHHAKFCSDQSYCCRDVAMFCIFLDDHT